MPTAVTIGNGVLDGTPWGVLEYVAGVTPEDGEQVRRTPGEYARTIAGIDPAPGPDPLFGRFGRDLPQAWRRHVDFNVAALGAGAPLIPLGVFEISAVARIVDVLRRTEDPVGGFGLSPGNLSVRNLVREPAGWSSSTGGVPGRDRCRGAMWWPSPTTPRRT